MIDTDDIQTACITLATLAMGFYFGSQFTGRQAKATYTGQIPEWITTVKTVNMAVLGVFGLCVIGAVAIDHYKGEQ